MFAILFAIIFIGVLIISGVFQTSEPRSRVLPASFSTPPQDPVTLMVVGTSLSTDYDWPETAVDRLATCLDRPVNLIRITRNGATSRWGRAAFSRYIQRPDAVPPDVVLMEFTVNDADIRHRISPKQSAELTHQILNEVTGFAPDARVVLLGMYSGTGLRGALRFRHGAYLDQYQNLATTLSNVGFRDMSPDWETYLSGMDRAQRKRALPDGLHPDPISAQTVLSRPIADFVNAIWPNPRC